MGQVEKEVVLKKILLYKAPCKRNKFTMFVNGWENVLVAKVCLWEGKEYHSNQWNVGKKDQSEKGSSIWLTNVAKEK